MTGGRIDVWVEWMRLTERDQRMIRWINGFGFVTVKQVERFMRVDFSTAARRVRVLCDEGLLKRRPFPASTLTVLAPTAAGCALANDQLFPIKGIRVGTSRHDLMLVDCAMALEKKFRLSFEPERRLRARSFENNGHLPDGLLHGQNARLIAVELELSLKAPQRLAAILDAYASNLDIAEVWYVVIDDAVERHVRRLAHTHQHVKVGRWRPNSTNSSGLGAGNG